MEMKMFRNRLLKVYRHLSRVARKQHASCYRIYDHDIPEFPFCVEIYEGRIYMAEYRRRFRTGEAEHEAWIQESMEIISTITGIEIENIFIKERRRKSGRQDQYERLDDQKNHFVVEESGLKFRVNLSDYLDTGLFLDHRETRKLIRSESEKKNVLNLFSYTGAFSVYAAAGGASAVTSVDLSNTYLDWSAENFHLNGLDGSGNYKFVRADVKQYLLKPQEPVYDVVIMDPPTFSNSKKMKDFLDIQSDHSTLINLAINLMKPGASLFFSTNFKKFVLNTVGIRASKISDITKATTAFDFQNKFSRFCYRIQK
ncbi:MAG TPA: class I SAM-dependent methyltransferase [Puia sp.]|nr:class I SAM-dependent methyltransferase [Puia sp.]